MSLTLTSPVQSSIAWAWDRYLSRSVLFSGEAAMRNPTCPRGLAGSDKAVPARRLFNFPAV